MYQDGFYGQVSKLPFLGLKDSVFDVAIAVELLEHLLNYEEGLREIKRIVKPEGMILLSVPDNCMGRQETDDHLQQFDRDQLRTLLEQEGEILFFDSVEDIGGAHLVAVLRKPV